MKAFHAVALTVTLGLLVLNLTPAYSQHLTCDDDDDAVMEPPDCPPNQGPEDNSTYYPYPYDCRKFFECSNGVPKCIRCAPGTVWDQEKHTCDHEAYTDCVIYTTTTATTTDDTEEPTTKNTTTTEEVPEEPTTTTTEEPTTTTTEEPTTTTTEEPTTTTTEEPTTTTTEEPTTTTTEEPTTTTTEEPTTTTTEEPTTTTTEEPTTTTTEEGPEEPTTTTTEEGPEEPTTKEPTTSESTTSTTPRPWNLCPVDDTQEPPGKCPPQEDWPTFFPYPYNCRKYFQCSNGNPICMQCANGTLWDQEQETCEREGAIECVIYTTTGNPLLKDSVVAVKEDNGIVGFFKKLFHH